MKLTIHLLTLFFFLSLSTLNGFAQLSGSDLEEFEKEKFLLTQRLLTCQSIAYSVINENDYNTKSVYIRLGNKNYNLAYQSFIALQKLDSDMDENLRKNISAMLELYAKSFSSLDALNPPEMALALSFGKSSLQFIIEKLYVLLIYTAET
jgi:hypothetical protein